jgi:acetyltransferase-like isoleucine patch superfamily enzyme
MAIEPERDLPPLLLANRVVVGTGAILFRGASVGGDSLIADLASVREKTTIGERSIVGRGVAVENEVTIGDRCKIEAGAFICAFSRIANDCFIAPEVTLTNDNFLGRTEERKKHYAGTTLRNGGRIGANATILPGVTIDTEGVAGAGSVVTKDVDPSTMVVGVPSRPLKQVPPEQQI